MYNYKMLLIEKEGEVYPYPVRTPDHVSTEDVKKIMETKLGSPVAVETIHYTEARSSRGDWKKSNQRITIHR